MTKNKDLLRSVDSGFITTRLLNAQSQFTYHWHRRPGTFVKMATGEEFEKQPLFHGTVREWYETLMETINSAFTKLQPDKRVGVTRGIIVSRDVLTVLQSTVFFRPCYGTDKSADEICAIGSDDHVLHGWLSNAPVYTNDNFERNYATIFITGCDFCQTIKVATIHIHGMEIFSGKN